MLAGASPVTAGNSRLVDQPLLKIKKGKAVLKHGLLLIVKHGI